MSKEQTYYQQRLPELIKRLKSQVQKNFAIINREVESDLGSDKYLNVLKGRRIAAENSLKGMRQIVKLEEDLNVEKNYYKEQLPYLIEHLKAMIDINLEVVDIEIDEDDEVELKDQIGDEIKNIFGPELSKKIFRSLKSNDKLSEDKFFQVLRARDTAAIDTEWALKTIDELERELQGKDKQEVKKSWALAAADL